jgi:hypothetical protein
VNRAAVVELLTGDTREERRARRLAEAEEELAGLREQGRYPPTSPTGRRGMNPAERLPVERRPPVQVVDQLVPLGHRRTPQLLAIIRALRGP